MFHNIYAMHVFSFLLVLKAVVNESGKLCFESRKGSIWGVQFKLRNGTWVIESRQIVDCKTEIHFE